MGRNRSVVPETSIWRKKYSLKLKALTNCSRKKTMNQTTRYAHYLSILDFDSKSIPIYIFISILGRYNSGGSPTGGYGVMDPLTSNGSGTPQFLHVLPFKGIYSNIYFMYIFFIEICKGAHHVGECLGIGSGRGFPVHS